MICVYHQTHTKCINVLCEQNTDFLNFKVDGIVTSVFLKELTPVCGSFKIFEVA